MAKPSRCDRCGKPFSGNTRITMETKLYEKNRPVESVSGDNLDYEKFHICKGCYEFMKYILLGEE